MGALKTALLGLLTLFRQDPLTKAIRSYQEAMCEHARRLAECHYEQHLMVFFDEEAGKVDPHTDWRHFANLKDSWLKHATDLAVETRRLAKTEAKVTACKLRLETLNQG